MSQRHKVFVSFHHANDQAYRERFTRLFEDRHDVLVDRSVGDQEIPESWSDEQIRQYIRDNYLRDATVTVVLIGADTWGRKHVDWEIYSTLRDTKHNSEGGLLGILLPPYGSAGNEKIPARLLDNLQSGYATLHQWSTNPAEVQGWIHAAFLRRTSHYYSRDLSRPLRRRNSAG